MNPKIKELWKSANICQSYEQIISLVFLGLTRICVHVQDVATPASVIQESLQFDANRD